MSLLFYSIHKLGFRLQEQLRLFFPGSNRVCIFKAVRKVSPRDQNAEPVDGGWGIIYIFLLPAVMFLSGPF